MRAKVAPSLALKGLASLWLVIAADWLFYAEPLGWTAGAYALLALGLLCAVRPAVLKPRAAKIIALLLVGIAASMAAAPGLLPFLLFVTGLLALLVMHKRGALADAALFAKDSGWLLLRALLQWSRDRNLIRRLRLKKLPPGTPLHLILTRAVPPVLLSVLFCCLFVNGNPILSRTFDLVDWAAYVDPIFSPLRWGFWLLVALVSWAVLRPRSRLAAPVAFSLGQLNLARWLDKNSLVMSLLAFNAIFAVQNTLDIAFLWNGEGGALPDGLSYAEYAHAGAYPLIATALLAGLYVLVTFDDNQKQYQTAAARVLVALWVLQNIFLVVSSIDRTLMYISIYSLTWLRIAALVWMGLVAAGLGFIIARIFFRRSNCWLVNINAITLVAVLYACCFVSFDRMIADYNVHHSFEVTGKGARLDFAYLQKLGPDALPALRWFSLQPVENSRVAAVIADQLGAELASQGWRAWTLRRQSVINEMQKEYTP
jgi:hypothetical protein